MTKRNAANERIKRRYLVFLKDAKGRDEASIDAAAKAIARFEQHSKHRDFKVFHFEQARSFKIHLMAERNVRTGNPLSASTVHSTLSALKAFFVWLAQQPGYASRIKFADADYFTPSENVSRIATAQRFTACPTLKQVRAMLGSMPNETEVNKRDRALVAFTILSGARDRAIISFRLKHVDIDRDLIEQDARDVRTKRAKTFTTWFFPVGDDIRQIVVEWVKFLQEEKGFGPDDPLFPKTKVAPGRRSRVSGGYRSTARRGPTQIRFASIFREACALAGLPYFNPHSLRNTLVQLAYELKLDAERFKAWSQNLGHESCLTTFSSYGQIPPARQAEIIRGLSPHGEESNDRVEPALLRKLADEMERAHRLSR